MADQLIVTGKFLGASKIESVGQNNFLVRRFYVELTTNPEYPNTPEFQLKGDKVNLVDNLQNGQTIQVKFNIDGRRYKNPQTNKEGVITNLNAWKIDVVQMTSAAVAPTRPAAVTPARPAAMAGPGSYSPAINSFEHQGDDSNDLPF